MICFYPIYSIYPLCIILLSPISWAISKGSELLFTKRFLEDQKYPITVSCTKNNMNVIKNMFGYLHNRIFDLGKCTKNVFYAFLLNEFSILFYQNDGVVFISMITISSLLFIYTIVSTISYFYIVITNWSIMNIRWRLFEVCRALFIVILELLNCFFLYNYLEK